MSFICIYKHIVCIFMYKHFSFVKVSCWLQLPSNGCTRSYKITRDHPQSKDSIALTCSFYRRNCQPAHLIVFPHGKSIYLYVSFTPSILTKEQSYVRVRLKKIEVCSAFLLTRNITVHARKKKRQNNVYVCAYVCVFLLCTRL